ncbi:MAG: ferritin family protein [Nitrospiraceae bacterium]|nr:ferritin family protein [Nitrospiraceae bacterium]
MISGKTGLSEAIIEAYTMEKGQKEFYERAAQSAHEPVVRETFQRLAGWEAGHMGYLRHFYSALMEEREPLSFDEFSKTVKPDQIEGGIPVRETGDWLKNYVFLDEIGALAVALKAEADTIVYYKNLASRVQDPQVQVLIQELGRLEDEHLKVLKDLRLQMEETS